MLSGAGAASTARVRRVGIAADHGGFELKKELSGSLRAAGYEVEDFGAHRFDGADDYPDFIIPLARAVAASQVERAVALCGSGVGASVTANKVAGVRAGLIHDEFSAHPKLSLPDAYAYSLAASRRWTLLTGDAQLRAAAHDARLSFYGVLWVCDQIFDAGVIASELVALGLEASLLIPVADCHGVRLRSGSSDTATNSSTAQSIPAPLPCFSKSPSRIGQQPALSAKSLWSEWRWSTATLPFGGHVMSAIRESAVARSGGHLSAAESNIHRFDYDSWMDLRERVMYADWGGHSYRELATSSRAEVSAPVTLIHDRNTSTGIPVQSLVRAHYRFPQESPGWVPNLTPIAWVTRRVLVC